MSPHFHFHNDRNLSSNSTTICFLLDGSCLSLVSQSLSLKPWLVKGVWPEVEKCDNFYIYILSLSRWPEIVIQYIKMIEKDWRLLCDQKKTNQSNGIKLVLALIFILVQKSSLWQLFSRTASVCACHLKQEDIFWTCPTQWQWWKFVCCWWW